MIDPAFDGGWNIVGPGTPYNMKLETYRAGEKTTGLSACRILSIGDEPEWIDCASGVTTVTHSTYAPPTHWRWERRMCEHCERIYGEPHRKNCMRVTETFVGRPYRAAGYSLDNPPPF
jgi:hypothetical protein